MTNRRTFVNAAALAWVGATLDVRAQRPDRKPRIALLAAGENFREPPFWLGMRALGYVDGRTMVVDRVSAEGDFSKLPALAAELVKRRPDVIVALTSAAAIAARGATSTIPIVLAGVTDPVASGLVTNLARPGGNLTGTSSQSTAAVAKQIEFVRQLKPSATRIAALWHSVNAVSQQLRLAEGLIAAARMRMLVRIVEVRMTEDLERAFFALAAERPDAVLSPGDTFFFAHAKQVAELGIAHRLPVIASARQMTDAGALASYGADAGAMAGRAATHVQRILKGAKAGDLAIELPTKFELVINDRTAKAIGIEMPTAILARADEVIR